MKLRLSPHIRRNVHLGIDPWNTIDFARIRAKRGVQAIVSGIGAACIAVAFPLEIRLSRGWPNECCRDRGNCGRGR